MSITTTKTQNSVISEIRAKKRNTDVARKLKISGMGVGKCVDPGKKILDKPEIIKEHLAQV